MLALRLAKLIETHADRLSSSLVRRLEEDPRCSGLRKVPKTELLNRSYELYSHLSEWAIDKSDKELEETYTRIGMRRAEQGVAYSQLLYAILKSKEQLWTFLRNDVPIISPVELYGEMELFQLVDQFFDRAIYYMSIGYERVEATEAA
jgi:hypothetical protein